MEQTREAQQKRYRYSEKGKAANARWTRKKRLSLALERPFIGWDGEGVSLADGSHIYTSFASSSGDFIRRNEGLKSFEIFETLLERKRQGDAIHVIYGGSYDFNMWLSDFPYTHVEALYRAGHVLWGHYRLEWRQGKYFRITDRRDNETVLVNDVVSFFQRPFVQACDEYLGDAFIERDLIVKNKAKRGEFTEEDSDEVDKYNQAELDNLVMLMTELRKRLANVGLHPSRWDGPGAVAVALMKREGVKDALKACPEEVARAARFAYAGGRFEVIKYGDVKSVCYEYDINSAYPYALQYVPNLRKGSWKHSHSVSGKWQGFVGPLRFALYRVEWEGDISNIELPQPFFVRGKKGNVFYPLKASGWYWAPEVHTAQRYVNQYGGELRIYECWEFIADAGNESPFAFIPPLFKKRQALKKAGDGAHVGIKLGLNSLYGKTCQKVGFKPATENHPAKIPPYHQLEYAGFTTSVCRSLALGAALGNLENIIAFETDALFSSVPLDIPIGSNLGEWEVTEFSHLCYTQSGFYFGTDSEGEPIDKTRGIDRGSMTYADVHEAMRKHDPEERVAKASLTRFVTVGLALQLNDWARWRRWEKTPKKIKLSPQGKREHVQEMCCENIGFNPEYWHYTVCPMSPRDMHYSEEYPIPWINPNPDMTELEDMTIQHREFMSVDYE